MIGFKKDKNSIGETQTRTCWVICDAVPVCVAVDRIRPCTPVEILAFHYTQTKSSSPLHKTTVADPSRTADEDEDEDERDDEMSKPAQITKAEKRKNVQTDETAKELRAPLPIAASSHASSLRPSDETQEQLVRSSKQARTGKNRVGTLQVVSYLFQK